MTIETVFATYPVDPSATAASDALGQPCKLLSIGRGARAKGMSGRANALGAVKEGGKGWGEGCLEDSERERERRIMAKLGSQRRG